MSDITYKTRKLIMILFNAISFPLVLVYDTVISISNPLSTVNLLRIISNIQQFHKNPLPEKILYIFPLNIR